jgi:hypothetical protein
MQRTHRLKENPMVLAAEQVTTHDDQYTGHGISTQDAERRSVRSSYQEAKSAFKTTEFYVYLAAVAGVLTASYLAGSDDGTNLAGSNGASIGFADIFAADKAWLYIVILTVGYLLSRGLAKSGSRTEIDG